MKVYKNLAGNVGVCAYEFRNDTIRVKFHTRKTYLFDNKYSGEDHIKEMRKLAEQGFGLNEYIIREGMIDKYAAILD